MPLVSLRNHYRIGLAIMLVILCAGVPVAWLKTKLVYNANAVIYVAPKFVNILQENRDQDVSSYQQYRQFIEQQARTVGRYDILLDALNKLGDRRFVWQAPGESERRAAERLQAALVIKAVKDTYLITVGLESNTSDGLDEVLNSVLATYLEKAHQEEVFYASDKRLASLRKRREDLVRTIATNTHEQLAISQELGVTTFSDNGESAYDRILIDSRTALAEAQRRRVEAEANFNIFDVARNKDAQTALNAAVSEIVAKDVGLASLKASLHTRKAKLQEQYGDLDAAHPLYAQIQRELANLDQEAVQATDKLATETRTRLVDQRRGDLSVARQVERELSSQLENYRVNASGFSSRYTEALRLKDDIARDRKQLEMVDNRINFLEIESQAPGFVRIETLARPPEFPIGGSKKKSLLMVGVLALLAGLAVPIVIDLLDRRIKTMGQVEKLLGYKPLAGLFEPSEDRAVRHLQADSKRRLAMSLYRESQNHDSFMILMTSVKPEAGVTSLAFELAVEFENIGSRAIVVETNPFKPDARYASGAASKNLLDLMALQGSVAEAIQPPAGPLPDRIAVGLPVTVHFYDYPRLKLVLEEIRQIYPIVILDAPPVLLSADTEHLASVADITLLLIGAQQVNPGELKRAARILEKINPKIISFIVTRLKIYHGGGYYEKMVKDYESALQSASQVISKNLGIMVKQSRDDK